MPGYLAKQRQLKAKGIDEVIVYCVNDSAVMKAWAKELKVEGSMITFLADQHGELTEKLGLTMTDPAPLAVLGNHRCKRFAAYLEDGVIRVINVSEGPGDPAGDEDPSKSCVEQMLSEIQAVSGGEGGDDEAKGRVDCLICGWCSRT